MDDSLCKVCGLTSADLTSEGVCFSCDIMLRNIAKEMAKRVAQIIIQQQKEREENGQCG
jgi:hypothetical protein